MQITLIRHGESVSNAAGIWQGHSDAQLSHTGRTQAAALAHRLASTHSFTRLLSSDLKRAHATAITLGEAVGMPVETQPQWREINLGRWEGLSRDEVHARWPDEVAALARGEDVPVGGGERWSDLGARIVAAVWDLAESSAPDEHVAVVAHGGVIITLLSDLLGVSPARPRLLGKLTNTSLTSLAFTPGGVQVLAYNDGLHVDAAATWRNEAARSRAVLALRADAGAQDPGDLSSRLAQPGHAELAVPPSALLAWSSARLPAGRRASPALPQTGSRSIRTGARPDGTLWTWNEGGAFLA